MKKICGLLFSIAAATLIPTFNLVYASENDSSKLLTVDRIFHEKAFTSERYAPIKWIKESNYFTTVEASTTVDDGFDIVRHDPATDDTQILVSAEQLTPRGGEPLDVKGYSWSDNGQYVLIHTNTVKFRRYRPLGDYWLLDLRQKELRQIGAEHPASSLMYAKFSPDSAHIAYLYANNIYVENTQTGATRALTSDGTDLIVNGTGDWVNEEEFGLRDGFSWSPDSNKIAYWQFDTEGVGTFHMIKNTDGLYSKPIPLQYPKAGTTNSAVRVGSVDLSSGETTWIKLKGDPRQNYVPEMSWADNADELIIQRMNRLQNRSKVLIADVETGKPRTLFKEKDDAWIDVNEDLTWFDDGQYFTWLSDRDGWRRLYAVSRRKRTSERHYARQGRCHSSVIHRPQGRLGLLFGVPG